MFEYNSCLVTSFSSTCLCHRDCQSGGRRILFIISADCLDVSLPCRPLPKPNNLYLYLIGHPAHHSHILPITTRRFTSVHYHSNLPIPPLFVTRRSTSLLQPTSYYYAVMPSAPHAMVDNVNHKQYFSQYMSSNLLRALFFFPFFRRCVGHVL